jgi:hypothetical protein
MTSAENTATNIANTATMNPKVRERRIGIENTAWMREEIGVPASAVTHYVIALIRQCPARRANTEGRLHPCEDGPQFFCLNHCAVPH